ncbi:MAG: hypothetical protein HYZ34_11945 [Ignavibacteriae bacterium]|nr:hypothetical protein [Ignavibacteriota bacterium]
MVIRSSFFFYNDTPIKFVLCFLIVFIVLACKKDEDPVGTNNNTNNAACDVVYLPAEVTGGCNIQLVTPTKCEEIDLTNGKTYEFAWTTGGTMCETPYTLIVAGNPVSEPNSKEWQFSHNPSNGITNNGGGVVQASAVDLDGLTSDNGTYHWVVKGFYGSHPASRTFRVKK